MNKTERIKDNSTFLILIYSILLFILLIRIENNDGINVFIIIWLSLPIITVIIDFKQKIPLITLMVTANILLFLSILMPFKIGYISWRIRSVVNVYASSEPTAYLFHNITIVAVIIVIIALVVEYPKESLVLTKLLSLVVIVCGIISYINYQTGFTEIDLWNIRSGDAYEIFFIALVLLIYGTYTVFTLDFQEEAFKRKYHTNKIH